MGISPRPLEPRFYERVATSEEDDCWHWLGAMSGSPAKYGYIRTGMGGRTDPSVPAHRVAYEMFVGPIPEGWEVDHVRATGCLSGQTGSLWKDCVNPEHLEAVTVAENRKRARLTTCRSGRHDLTDPANVFWAADGTRRGCRLCQNESRRRYEARLRERARATERT